MCISVTLSLQPFSPALHYKDREAAEQDDASDEQGVVLQGRNVYLHVTVLYALVFAVQPSVRPVGQERKGSVPVEDDKADLFD